MNDRLTTLAGAVLALVLFVALVYQPARAPQVSSPTSAETRANGYAGLKRWLDATAVPTLSLRERLTALKDRSLPDRGNIMLVTLPYRHAMRPSEIEALSIWVAQGNTLLVLAALNDSPDWILYTDTSDFVDDVEAVTGLGFSTYAEARAAGPDEPVADPDAGDVSGQEIRELTIGSLIEPTPLHMYPEAGHPLMAGVTRLAGVTDSITSLWTPRPDNPFSISVAREDMRDLPAMWQRPLGEGFILVSASASLLTNRMLGAADNARFVANLLAHHLRPDGVVVFDDMHQGLSSLYDPEAFFGDTRLHATLGFLLLFWLIYLVGTSVRLGPGASVYQAPQQADLVRAVSGFMARKLTRQDAGRLLVDQWLESLVRKGRVQADRAPWPQLAAMPLMDQALLAAVQADYAALGRGRKVPLTRLHNHIHELKGILA